jgi:hypothetical protein
MLTVDPSFPAAMGGHTPRPGNLSIVESVLSVSDSNVGSTGPTASRRRSSVMMRRTSRTGSILSSRSDQPLIQRVPVHLDEVASRIDDAAEGTIIGWPYDQECVPRSTNVLLNTEEMRQRYGNRLQPFAPVNDVTSSEDSLDRKRARGHRQRKQQQLRRNVAMHDMNREASLPPQHDSSPPRSEQASPYRQVVRVPSTKQLITSNAQLVSSVRAAKDELRIRLREETHQTRLLIKVKQWKDRVVDFAPSGLLQRDAKLQYDPLLDPVHLHQECMRDILVDESKVAEALFQLFQKQAREGEDMRRKRQEEEDASSWLPSVHTDTVRARLDNLTNLMRPHEPRAPFHQRFMGGPSTGVGDSRRGVGVFGETIRDLKPERDGQGLLPVLPPSVAPLLLLPYISGSRAANHSHTSPKGHGRAVEEIIRDTPQTSQTFAPATSQPQKDISPRKAPWAIGAAPPPMEPAILHGAPHHNAGFTNLSPTAGTSKHDTRSSSLIGVVSPRSRMRAELQHIKYVPSSSSHVDAVVRSMVSAYQTQSQEQSRSAPFAAGSNTSKRRMSKFAETDTAPEALPSGDTATSTKKGRSRSIVSMAAEGLVTHATEEQDTSGPSLLRPSSPSSLPESWPEVHIPSDCNIRAALHERLLSEASSSALLPPCPDGLICPMAQELMSEPILVSDGSASTASLTTLAEASLDRSSWEYVLDGLQAGTLAPSKLPPPLDSLFSKATVAHGLVVRLDTFKVVSLIKWRSTMLWMLANATLRRHEAFHIAVGLVNDIIEGAIDDDLSQSSSLLRTAKTQKAAGCGGAMSLKGGSVVEHRRVYPVSMVALHAAAVDAHQHVMKIAPMLESVRSSGQRVLKSLESLQSKRGCYERDLMRLHVRLTNSAQGGPSAPPSIEDIERIVTDMRRCDEELNAQAKLLLDLERRYASLRSTWASLANRIDAYNEHVSPFNKFSAAQKAYWGPIYKATLSACHTVVASLINREMHSSRENRTLLQNVAECLEEPTVVEMLAKLPSLLVRLETRMRQAKQATSPLLPLTDAAFVIMSPYAQFEDIIATPPHRVVNYPMLRDCPPFVEPESFTGVANGIAMLRRKSIPLPLPPSPRGAAARDTDTMKSRPQPHHDGPSNSEVLSRIVRTVGSDPSTPFWHFVRKSGAGDPRAAHKSSDVHPGDTISSAVSARDEPKSGLVGLRGINTPNASSSVRLQNDKASLFVVAPGQRFMAQEPKHAMSIHSGRRALAH